MLVKQPKLVGTVAHCISMATGNEVGRTCACICHHVHAHDRISHIGTLQLAVAAQAFGVKALVFGVYVCRRVDDGCACQGCTSFVANLTDRLRIFVADRKIRE